MQKEVNSIEELSLKKRARRRLVGAIALVLLMIIVLPMILKDRSLVQPKEQITITLPDESLPDITGDNVNGEDKVIEKPKDDFDSNIDNANKSSEEPADQNANQVPVESLKNNAELNNSANVDSVENQMLDEKSAELKADKEAKKIINKKPVELNNAAIKKQDEIKTGAVGLFYVQVGVFSDVNNVKQLESKLNEIGYKSQTEKINTDKGVKIRLRTQSFSTRASAADALEIIKDAGLTGMVVSKAGA